MNKLYKKLKTYSLEDAIKFEKSDRQFLALKDLYENKQFNDENYLFLTVANALVCYQLSGKGEDYWEEFDKTLQNRKIDNFNDVEIFFEDFLPVSKNNKRFMNTKLKRIKKLSKFYTNFIKQIELYYKDMDKLAQDLSLVMNQQKDTKTIVFAVKMFSYSARNIFGYLEYFPQSLMLPIDSRLEKLYYKYNDKDNASKKEIKIFYTELAKKLNIPPLHLDAVLWTNYDKLLN